MAPPRDRRPGFSRRAQYGVFFGYILAVAGGVVGAVLLALSLLNPTAFSAARAGVAEVTAPVSSAVALAVDSVSGIPDAIASWWDVHGKNAALTAQAARARPALVAGHLAQLENARLRRLLAVRDLDPAVVVTARIVSSSATSTRRYGLLNAGTWQGVREGQPVLGPEGLVGRVLEVGPNTARLLPWTTVMAGSLLTVLPIGATLSLLPPCGLLVLLSWRLLAPFAIRLWAPAALGLFDDIVSGQPIGSAVLLWTLAYFLVSAMEARSGLRDFWQNWAIAAAAIALCLIGGRLIATPLAAHVEVALAVQIALSVLIFPAVAFLIGRIDARRAR